MGVMNVDLMFLSEFTTFALPFAVSVLFWLLSYIWLIGTNGSSSVSVLVRISLVKKIVFKCLNQEMMPSIKIRAGSFGGRKL